MKLRKLAPLILTLMGLIILLILIPQAVRYLTKAGGVEANIVIDYEGILGFMPTPWRNLAQGGEEAKPMLGNVINQIKALRPEYIRIDHIYDAYDVVRQENGQLKYDWSRLDTAVNEILTTGAKPFLVLSYMPTAISQGDVTDLPKDWGEWGRLVRATIEHYSGKENRNLKEVIYEVWNEPDLFGNYRVYGKKNYLVMYEVSARAAMQVRNANSFEIGGPATTGLYKNWLEGLIKFAAKKKLRMDFVSWHRYSQDIEQFDKDVRQAQLWADKIPALTNLKFYITEWGHNSENDSGYDQKFGAIHTMAGVRTMMARADRVFVFEIKDGPGDQKYWNRWGLLTHEKFGLPEMKPRFKALQFLNQLENFRVSLAGEGSWVKGIASTNQAQDLLKVLLINYDPQRKHSENVPITFQNLPQRNFTYVREDFLGSASRKQVATDSAIWKTTEFLPANSAMMLRLEF